VKLENLKSEKNMAGQYEILKCPFCDKGEISCLYFPSAVSVHHVVTSKGGRGNLKERSKEIWLIQTGCSVCGKTKEEVEKKLKTDNII
jgi:hypothetical protein